jgi:peptide/nickel transport system substrate-binding protein
MKQVKKLMAGLLAAAMTISLAGCRSGAKAGSSLQSTNSSASSTSSIIKKAASSAASSGITVQTSGGFSLPYNSVTDFNPLLPSSQSNMNLWPLIYDCLAEPDDSYRPVMRLATSVQCSGTTVTVTLKDGVLFTDGNSFSAADVAYSYKMAMSNTLSPYHSRLLNIASITQSGLSVTIILKTPDALFANLLDVPIIENNTGVTSNAVGTGRYSYQKDGVNARLVRNNSWYGGKQSAFKTIPLVNIANSNAIIPSLSIGEINYVYTDGGNGETTATTNTTTAPVNLNRLIYLGVNASRQHLDNAHFRRALSYSINRKSLVSQIYSSRAQGCVLPFNPAWSALAAPKQSELTDNFAKESYEMKRSGAAGASISLTLLVNADNSLRTAAARFVASCLTKTGVSVKVEAVSYGTYAARIKQKKYDLYIGETQLAADMDISPLLASGGAASYGLVAHSHTLAVWNGWRAGNTSIKTVSSVFLQEMPFIPLCYRMGATSYTIGLSGVKATDGDIFFDFEDWKQ